MTLDIWQEWRGSCLALTIYPSAYVHEATTQLYKIHQNRLCSCRTELFHKNKWLNSETEPLFAIPSLKTSVTCFCIGKFTFVIIFKPVLCTTYMYFVGYLGLSLSLCSCALWVTKSNCLVPFSLPFDALQRHKMVSLFMQHVLAVKSWHLKNYSLLHFLSENLKSYKYMHWLQEKLNIS